MPGELRRERGNVCLNLPALKNSNSGLPTSPCLGSLYWGLGGRDHCLAGGRSMFVFYTHTYANWSVPRHIFEAFQVTLLLVLVSEANRRLLWWYFFQSLLWKTTVRGEEHSVFLTFPGSTWLCNMLLGRGARTKYTGGPCYLHYSFLSAGRGATSEEPHHQSGTELEPCTCDISFKPHSNPVRLYSY